LPALLTLFLLRQIPSSLQKAAYWPVPFKGMSIEVALRPLKMTSMVEVFGPVDVGLKVTLIVRIWVGLMVLLLLPPVVVNMDASSPVMNVDIV